MVYLDNSATTLQKPPEVYQAVDYAMKHFGNSGRSFYESVLLANRGILAARREIAALVGLDNPLQIAFTSSATESLNLVIQSLVTKEDHVITTELEHNSVLRPLYQKGCPLTILPLEENGFLSPEALERAITPDTTFFFANHGSNVLGNLLSVEKYYEICKKYNILFILDVSQTLGATPVSATMADILCFTGHKSLYGPQGTGGIIVSDPTLPLSVAKTGGTGSDSFSKLQSPVMPDVFEAGTLNSHGLHGLQAGAAFVNKVGIDNIRKKGDELTQLFLNGLFEMSGFTIYSKNPSLPIISLNHKDYSSEDLAYRLWDEHKIAVRAGSHCAPLVHQRYDTVQQGMVRFSFSFFTTEEDIKKALQALNAIVEE